MAMSKGTSHYNRQVWEDSSFPILCETCLGDNPFVQMMKETYGSECKICARPFTTFRWCPGRKMRYKKTEICQTCARAKNVCQTCLLDLAYGLPVQVRDNVLNINQEMPQSDVNREYFNQCLDKQVKEAESNEAYGPHKSAPTNETLLKLGRNSPYYKRNLPHICSFWVKGECKRGDECPYRHEKPADPDDPLSDQNIKDRYYGTNDPVADKLLKRVATMPQPVAPEDKSVTTLYIGNVNDNISEKNLRDYFYQFGEIRSIHIVTKQSCAFITYTTREAAQLAIDRSFQRLTINGQKLNIRWGRSQAKKSSDDNQGGSETKRPKLTHVPGLPIGAPGQEKSKQLALIPSTVSSSLSLYPSQDPSQLGSYNKSK